MQTAKRVSACTSLLINQHIMDCSNKVDFLRILRPASSFDHMQTGPSLEVSHKRQEIEAQDRTTDSWFTKRVA